MLCRYVIGPACIEDWTSEQLAFMRLLDVVAGNAASASFLICTYSERTTPVSKRTLAAFMFFVFFFNKNMTEFRLVLRLVKCSAKKFSKFLAADKLGCFDICLMGP